MSEQLGICDWASIPHVKDSFVTEPHFNKGACRNWRPAPVTPQSDQPEQGGPLERYNEPFVLAKQRVAIVERVMKLPYIKAQRDTEEGEVRLVCRDDVISTVHDYAKITRGVAPAVQPSPAGSEVGWLIERNDGRPEWVILQLHPYRAFKWTADSVKSLRFARKQDAEAVITFMQQSEVPLKATEHAWVAPAVQPAQVELCNGCRHPELWEPAIPTSKSGTSIPDWHHTRRERNEDGDKFYILCLTKHLAAPVVQPSPARADARESAAPLYNALMAIAEFHGHCWCGECDNDPRKELGGYTTFICIETKEAIDEYRKRTS